MYIARSRKAVGAALTEEEGSCIIGAVQFASRCLECGETLYSIFEWKAAVTLFGLKTYYQYLFASPFMAYSDHKPSKTSFEKEDVCGQLDR